MVHVKTGLTVEEAVERADGLSVVAILAEVRIYHTKTDLAEIFKFPYYPRFILWSRGIGEMSRRHKDQFSNLKG